MTGRILVTGGSGGIGGAIVRRLAGSGLPVDFTYGRNRDAARLLQDELGGGAPDAVRAIQCDLSDAGAVEALGRQLGDAPPYFGFIHAAGASYDRPAALVALDMAERLFRVNVLSMMALLARLLRGMAHQRAGRIIAISSITAHRGSRGNSVYAASKAAQIGYMRGLVGEVASRGITANIVSPGFVDTPLLEPYASARADLEQAIPAQRYARPEEIAGVVHFLVGEEAAYLNGAEVVIDGGLLARLGLPGRARKSRR